MKLASLSFVAVVLCGLAPTIGQAANQDQLGTRDVSSDCSATDWREQGGVRGETRPEAACATTRRARPVRVAQATSPETQVASAAAEPLSNQGASRNPNLEEVIVTAQKVQQPLLDVPVPVTAINANNLLQNNLVRIQDYYATVPGLNFTTDANGAPILSIRGLTTGGGNPTTAVTIDGVPFGSSSGYGGMFALLPDIDPSDLERVEVLRGPQGTLYGASSLGGLVNYVTMAPSTTQTSGRVEADLSSVQNGDGPGYAVRAAGNIPVSDSVALRVSGFGRHTPGYIDNVLTGENGTNRLNAAGGYLSLLVRPGDTWSLRLNALYQENRGLGLNYADPELGDLKQANIPGTGIYHSDAQAYSAILNAKLGRATFTSLSGYNVNSMHDVEDATNSYGSVAEAVFGVGGVQLPDWQRIDKFSQEFRLSLPITENVDWLLGLFYTHEKAEVHQQLWAEDMNTGVLFPGGNILDATWPSTYTDYAAFTNFTIHFTDKFNIQLGGRESQNRQTYSEVDGGGYTTIFGFPQAPAPVITPEVDTKDNSFTYLVTPQYKISQAVMVYARVATGFRPGGPNPTCSAFGLPCHFDPDRTQDYEIGFKGDVLDHRLDFDTSVFYIDWKHIQLSTVPPCGCAILYVNAGSAKSQGVELSLQGRPTSTLTLSAWVDFTDAVLTASFPDNSTTVGNDGDRLPFSSRISGNFSAEKLVPVSERTTLFFGGQVSYVGNRFGYFEYLPQRAYYPAYAETNFRGGATVGDWRVTLFINNATNKRGVLGGTLPLPYGGNGFTYIQPRTIGLTATKNL